MSSKLEAVIFDCDGVIVDSLALQQLAEQETALEFAEAHGLPFDADSVEWDTMQGWARKRIAANIYGIGLESEEADQFRLAVVEKTVEIADEDNTPLIKGIEAFANYLSLRGLVLGVATSSNRAIYNQYCAINAMDFFSPRFIVTYGECRDDKPKPGPFIEVMRRMDVDPARTLVIEDSASGISAGRFAGAQVLGLATTKSVEYLRTNTSAQFVAADFPEAAKVLQGILPN